MKKKPLSQTNPYLKDPKKRKQMIERSVKSSTAIEGIEVSAKLKNTSKKQPLKEKTKINEQ